MSIPSRRALPWINAALFQTAWLAIVLSAANDQPWIAPIVTGVVLAWHLYNAHRPRIEVSLIGIAMALGAGFETLMVALEIIEPASGAPLAGFAAYWLVCLWAVFATTLNVSLRWLRPRTVTAAALGALGGPLAYAGGAKLGALQLESSYPSIGVLAFGWALATPLLLATARRLDGYSRP